MRSRRQAGRLIVIALVAALVAPSALAGGHAFDYTFAWREGAYHVMETSGTTREGHKDRVDVVVDMQNLTALRFLLTWKDEDRKGPATVELAVVDPEGHERARVNETARNGTVEIIARVQEVPPGTVTIRADSDAEAWQEFHARYPSNAEGTGKWRAVVTVEDAGTEEAPRIPIGERGASRAWNLSVDAGAFNGVLEGRTPVQDDEPPGNSTTEMPPPDDDGDDPPETNKTTSPGGGPPGSILGSRGADSLLVLVGAVIGIAGALYLARRAPT